MVENSKQFYINIEDKPYWNPSKPYDQQSRDAKQFMVEEAKKLKKGLNINGVKIHPWLYWHVNFWNMMVDKKVEGNPLPISVPEVAHLRDNEWLLQQSLIRSEELNKGIIGFGARRLGKSGFISSFTAFNATTIYGGELRVDSIVGGSQEDLDNITSYIDFGLDKIHPFFKMDKVGKDWSKGVTLGTRNVDNTKEIYSTITVTNINKGAISSSQKTAGATPKSSIWDEIGKFSFMKAFNAFKYSIATQYGWRTTPLLFGCLTENNKVWTANGDLISIKDLKASDGIIGFDRNDGEFSVEPITHQQNNYKKRCIKITTSTGKSVECSYDHPILTKFRNRTKYNKQTKKANRLVEFVEAETLKVGDTICVINTLPIFGQEEIKYARLIGQLIGDGTYGIDHGVRISTCDKEVYEPIFKLFNTRIEKTYKTKDGKDFYTIYIKEFTQYLRELGIHNQTKENKTLPVNTFRLTKESLSEMIGGIFDADGHVCLNKSKNRYTIGLTIGHKELLDEIVLG